MQLPPPTSIAAVLANKHANCERRHVGDAQVLHAGCVREFASITEQLPKLLKLDRDDQIVVPVLQKIKN